MGWFMLIMPLFFFGMMFLFCRAGRGTGFAGCCGGRGGSVMAAELSGMRREIEEIKKKIG